MSTDVWLVQEKEIMRTILAFVLGAAMPAMVAGGSPAAEVEKATYVLQAEQILAATGTQGGLIVHLGCGDGRLTAALRAGDSYTVHGLDADEKNVQQARKYIQSIGLYGKVSVDLADGSRLPYIDNLVNLIVVDTRCEMREARFCAF